MENNNNSMETDNSAISPSYSNDLASFSVFFPEKRQPKLQDVWPELESSLEDRGLSGVLKIDDRSMTVSKTHITRQRRYCFEKAKFVVELLATTHAPPRLAVEIMKGDLRFHAYVLIKIGSQDGGLCSEFGIGSEQYKKRWEWLALALEGIASQYTCYLFLNEDTAAAVGPASSVSRFRDIVDACIVKDENPLDFDSMVKWFMVGKEKRGEMMLEKSAGAYYEVSAFGTDVLTGLSLGRSKEVDQAWPFVESFLMQYGISCTLDRVDRYMSLSTTRMTTDADVVDSVCELLGILGNTTIPGSKIIELLKGRLQYEVIKTIGLGGLSNEIGKHLELVRSDVDIYIDSIRVVIVGSSAACLRELKSIVEGCFVKNEDLASAIKRLKLCCRRPSLMKKLEALSMKRGK